MMMISLSDLAPILVVSDQGFENLLPEQSSGKSVGRLGEPLFPLEAIQLGLMTAPETSSHRLLYVPHTSSIISFYKLLVI